MPLSMTCFGLIVVMWCQGEPPKAPPVSSDYCDISKPVRPSPQDTRGTIEQADREFRKYKALCPQGAKAK